MNTFQAIFLGIVEGFSEFLPISSTFHLLLTQQILKIPATTSIDNFIVIIQSGAIFAAVWLYWRKILFNVNLIKILLCSFFATGVIAFLGKDVVKDVFFTNHLLQIFSFILVGLLFFLTEYIYKKKNNQKNNDDITITDALLIGLAQSLALIPGVSRSGAVILFMTWRGFKRSQSAEYSFMLGIPTIFAASIFDMVDLIQSSQNLSDLTSYLIIGWLVAFIVALISIKWLISYLQKNTLNLFGWYRIIVGVLALLLLGK
jgi:undecaprenyl-diphosphatase